MTSNDGSIANPRSHLIIYPVRGHEACVPGEHDGWAVNAGMDDGSEINAGWVRGDSSVSDVLARIERAFPEMNGRVSVRWIGPDGALTGTRTGSTDEVSCELMEVVCDETPDDAETTDDHPLEEARTFLDELSMLRDQLCNTETYTP